MTRDYFFRNRFSVKVKYSIPNKATFVHRAAVIHHQNAYFYFGGYTNYTEYDRTIARLDGKTFRWSKLGQLNQGRNGHNVILLQSYFLVVGGYNYDIGSVMSEKCHYSSGKIKCTAQQPGLYYYIDFPELLAVPDNYCKKP